MLYQQNFDLHLLGYLSCKIQETEHGIEYQCCLNNNKDNLCLREELRGVRDRGYAITNLRKIANAMNEMAYILDNYGVSVREIPRLITNF